MFWLVATIVFFILFYRWATAKQGKWEAKGVKCIKPFPLLGSYPKLFVSPKPLLEKMSTIYNDLKGHKLGVFYDMREPILVINDPELIREVTVKSFDHFVDRTEPITGFLDIHTDMNKMLVHLTGEKWKGIRSCLSPAFTTGRLKGVVGIMSGSGPDLVKYLSHKTKDNEAVEMVEAFSRYTMGVIARAMYSIDAKVFEKEDSEFIKNSKAIHPKFKLSTIAKVALLKLVPSLAIAWKVRFISEEYLGFFTRVTKTLMAQRRSDTERGGDMLQLLMDIQQNKLAGSDDVEADAFEADARLDHVKVDSKILMSDDAIQQSAVAILFGSFDTTTSILSLIAYNLATNPEAQERAFDEVNAVASKLQDANASLSYQDLAQLEYLGMVLDESLRFTPLTPNMSRVCTRDCVLSNGVKVEKGDRVNIPTSALHKDPKYWDRPDEFIPERFSKEGKKSITPYTYLPFGVGPRNCIGMRLAVLEVKVALFYLLRSFRLEPSESTTVPPKYVKHWITTNLAQRTTIIAGGNWLRLVPRE